MGFLDRVSKLFEKAKKPPVISSTTEYPLPRDVFSFLIAKLEDEGGEYVTFQDQDDEKKWVQVKFVPDRTLLNFSYPFDEEPEQLLSKLQIAIPAGFDLESWENQLYATFNGPRLRHGVLADIVDELFVKLLKARFHYVVQGRI